MFWLSLILFQVVALMEGNLFWDRAHFFLDQTGEHNSHMVFPTIPKFCWRACWKSRTVVHASKDEILEQGPKKHWVTGLPKHHLEGNMSRVLHRVFHPWTESGALKFTCEPCTPIPEQRFQFDLFRSPEALAPDPRVQLCVAHGGQIWKSQIRLQFSKQKVDYKYDLQLIMDGSLPVCVCVCVYDPNRCVEKYEKLNGGRPRSTSCVAVIQSSPENILVPALPCGADLQPGTQRQACRATCRPHFSDLI